MTIHDCKNRKLFKRKINKCAIRHLSIRRTEFALEKQYNEYLRIEFSHRENMKTGVIEIQTDSLP